MHAQIKTLTLAPCFLLMHGFTSHNNVTKGKQTKKGKIRNLNSIREPDHRKKVEVVYTCRYTSEHLIPNSVMGIGINCPLVYLQM